MPVTVVVTVALGVGVPEALLTAVPVTVVVTVILGAAVPDALAIGLSVTVMVRVWVAEGPTVTVAVGVIGVAVPVGCTGAAPTVCVGVGVLPGPLTVMLNGCDRIAPLVALTAMALSAFRMTLPVNRPGALITTGTLTIIAPAAGSTAVVRTLNVWLPLTTDTRNGLAGPLPILFTLTATCTVLGKLVTVTALLWPLTCMPLIDRAGRTSCWMGVSVSVGVVVGWELLPLTCTSRPIVFWLRFDCTMICWLSTDATT